MAIGQYDGKNPKHGAEGEFAPPKRCRDKECDKILICLRAPNDNFAELCLPDNAISRVLANMEGSTRGGCCECDESCPP